MNRTSIANLARTLMNEHGLHDWNFRFDNAKRRAGACNFRTRTIQLSAPLMAQWAESAIRNTLLHEIAHAIAGVHHNHDRVWRAHARRIGCTGDRCWSPSEDAPTLPPTWIGLCPQGHETGRFRRPRGRVSCSDCSPHRFTETALITWHRNSVAA